MKVNCRYCSGTGELPNYFNSGETCECAFCEGTGNALPTRTFYDGKTGNSIPTAVFDLNATTGFDGGRTTFQIVAEMKTEEGYVALKMEEV